MSFGGDMGRLEGCRAMREIPAGRAGGVMCQWDVVTDCFESLN